MNYKQAGVDVALGDAFVEQIKSRVKRLKAQGVVSGIGPFAGLFDFSPTEWKDPILVGCTDGVGTKLKLAFELDRHDTIGIDLVAMNVNDLIVCGAKPLFFLDYLATAKLDLKTHLSVIDGIIEGCRQSRCALLGGETAEMPGMYGAGEYDLAGFAVGMVDRGRILKPDMIKPGDVLIGLPSTGFHSNGYSLVRRTFEDRSRFPLDRKIPGEDRSLGDVLLTPTRIYVPEVEIALGIPGVKSFAHITGGGITGNLPRAYPDRYGAQIRIDSWPIPPVMKLLQEEARIDNSDMYRTFNMGLGLIAVVDPQVASRLQDAWKKSGFVSYVIGRITEVPGVEYVRADPDAVVTMPDRQPYPEIKIEARRNSRLKIAVMGSGRGTNMDALLKASKNGVLDGEIVCVISNNSRAGILDIARREEIPVYHISSRTHADESDSDRAILEIMNKHGVELICLAGYMKRLSSGFLVACGTPVLNIHPALLPAFGGAGMYGERVHEAVIRSGAKYSGATVHLVDSEYDHGLILDQQIVEVSPDDTATSLAAKVLKVEHRLYVEAVNRWIRSRRS